MGVGGAGQGKAVVAAFPVILHPETLRRGQRSRSVWCQHRSVIPAPIAYIKVVVVKKLVVGSWTVGGGEVNSRTAPLARLTFGGRLLNFWFLLY